MLKFKTKTKKWGNSTGVIIPRRFAVLPDQDVEIIVKPKNQFATVGDIFGIAADFMPKEPTSVIMKQMKQDLYPEDE